MNHVLQAAALNEPAVLNALNEVGRYLGIGVASVAMPLIRAWSCWAEYWSLAGPWRLLRTHKVNARAQRPPAVGTICLSAFRFDA
jgi:hypothetical protein